MAVTQARCRSRASSHGNDAAYDDNDFEDDEGEADPPFKAPPCAAALLLHCTADGVVCRNTPRLLTFTPLSMLDITAAVSAQPKSVWFEPAA